MTTIAHLTSVHVPFDIRIFHKECKTLAAAGYDVVLIAPHEDPPASTTVDGVRLHPVPRPAGRRERVTRTVWQVYRAAIQEDADVYHFHDPELMPVGFLLKLQGKRVVYDVHEDMPRQILTRHWIPQRLRAPAARSVAAIEAVGSRVWDGVVAVTPTIARRFPEQTRVLVQNFPVPAELELPDATPYSQRAPLVVYAGRIEGVRGAQEMVRAMGALPDGTDAHLVLAGSFEPAELLQTLQRLPGWQRVTPLGWLTRPEIASLLGRARVGLVLLHPVENYLEAQPNKLFEYMAAGIPVVASDFPSWRPIVAGAGCGLLVDPLDPGAIARAIAWLLANPDEAAAMGERGREAVQHHFTWAAEGERLVRLYRSLLADPNSGTVHSRERDSASIGSAP